MKKILGFIGLMVISFLAIAQDLDSLVSDTLMVDTLGLDSIPEPPPYYAGAYFFAESYIGPHYGGYNQATNLGFGLQYNRWIAGFSVLQLNGRIEDLLVFPNVFELDYRYGGPTLGYELLDGEWVSWDVMASLSIGDMIWRNKQTNENFLRDKHSILTITSKVDFDKIRYVKPYVKFGYQKANNLDLTLVKPGDFTGLVFVFGIQIGYFNQ